LTLQEAGDRAGFAKSHMWEFERGRAVNPTIRMLLGLARAYGVSLEHIVGISTGEPPLHPDALRIAGDIDRLLQHRAKYRAKRKE
jgi:transcriptional regulator with XRE-family HTH domain